MEHKYKINITCPYCEYEDKDSWEFNEDEGEQTCGKCEKDFNVTREVTVTYSTSRIECEEGKHKYKIEDFHIKKTHYLSANNWEKLPEDKWGYFRIDTCELCDDKEYVDLTKEQYEKSNKEKY